MGGGDVLCQYIAHKRWSALKVELGNGYKVSAEWPSTFQWDSDSTLRNASLGSLVYAPVLHGWYGFLMRRKSLVTKVFLDQFVFLPFCLVSVPVCAATGNEEATFKSADNAYESIAEVFNSVLSFLEGKEDSNHVRAKIQQIPTEAYLGALSEVVRFKFVPAHFQVPYSNMFAVLWSARTTYLHGYGVEDFIKKGSSVVEKYAKNNK